tara:strand:- start:33 stop:344 length:312 start_codon:yes stop_codon:yes gene_type:complete
MGKLSPNFNVNCSAPKNDYEALVLALSKAWTATDINLEKCICVAEQIASRLSKGEIKRANREAKEFVDDSPILRKKCVRCKKTKYACQLNDLTLCEKCSVLLK